MSYRAPGAPAREGEIRQLIANSDLLILATIATPRGNWGPKVKNIICCSQKCNFLSHWLTLLTPSYLLWPGATAAESAATMWVLGPPSTKPTNNNTIMMVPLPTCAIQRSQHHLLLWILLYLPLSPSPSLFRPPLSLSLSLL